MRLSLQPLVDALRQHVAAGFASAFHSAVLAATPGAEHIQDHATGDALLSALLGYEPAAPLPLVQVYVVHAGQWVGLEALELAERHEAADLPASLSGALAAALCAGAQAHFRTEDHTVDSVSVCEVEGLVTGLVHLKLTTSDGPAPLALAFGGAQLSYPLSKVITISGPALHAAGEQALQRTEGGLIGLLNSIQLSLPAASGAIN